MQGASMTRTFSVLLSLTDIKAVIQAARTAELNDPLDSLATRLQDHVLGCGPAIYTVQFEADPNDAPVAFISAALQQELFREGNCLAGNYRNETIQRNADGTWQVDIERPDCESDYHLCYADEGHDGSDAAAIKQVQGEIDEDPSEPTDITRNFHVLSRRRA